MFVNMLLLFFSRSLGWKDETFSHRLGSKRKLFKWIRICLEDKFYNKSDFLVRILSNANKNIKGKLQVHSTYSTYALNRYINHIQQSI